MLSPLVSHDRHARALGGPDDPGARLPRRDDARSCARAAIQALRLAAVGLAFAAYALLLDHDRLLAGGRLRAALGAGGRRSRRGSCRRSSATRAGFVEALRGRGVARRRAARARARCSRRSSPARSSAALSLAEAMEARGFGRPGRTRAPAPPWTRARPARARRGAVLVAWGPCGSSAGRAATFAYPDAASRRSRRLAPGRAGRDRRAARPVRLRASRRSCARSRGSFRTSTAAASRAASRSAGRDTRRFRPAELAGDGRDGVPGSGGPDRPRPRRERGRVRAREPRHAARRDLAARPRRARERRHRAPRGARAPRALRRRAPARVPRGGARARAARCSSSTSRPRSSTPTEPRRSSTLARELRRGGRRLRAAAGAAARAHADRVALRRGRPRRCSTRPATRRSAWLERGVPAAVEHGLARQAASRGEVSSALERVSLRRTTAPVARRRLARAPARRDRRAHGSERRRARRRSRSSSPGSSSPQAGASSARAARATCSRIRAATSSPSVPSARSRSASAATSCRARAALAAVGLAGLERRHPRDLSSGERERLALATVLVAEPDVLVLDEPTRGVDPPRKSELAELLRAQAPTRATLVVTHDLVFAGDVADRESSSSSPGARACLAGRLRPVAASLAAAAWVAIDPAQAAPAAAPRGDGAARRGAAWLEAGPNASKEIALVATLAAAAAAGRVLLRRRAGGAAGDGDRDRGRCGARSARRLRDRSGRRARVELLPRPGALDAVADARLGRAAASAGALSRR